LKGVTKLDLSSGLAILSEMTIKDVMEADEKFVKSNESEAKTLFSNEHKLIRPVVISPSSGKPKVGAGWSMGEIRAAGLTRKQMKSLSLRIAKFRKTTHKDNIELLKKIKTTASL
jgi:ribosomal protein L13E